MEVVNPAHHSNLCGVVNKADVSLGGSVQLSDVNVPKAIQKFFPHVGSYSVTYSDLHTVVSVIISLQETSHTFKFNKKINVFKHTAFNHTSVFTHLYRGTEACTYTQTDGWVDRQRGMHMDRWIDKWTKRWIDTDIEGCGWMDAQRQLDGWIDRQT